MVKLEVEAGTDLIKSAQDGALKEAIREVKLPGFRKGKAPQHLVENAIDKEFIKRQ